MNLPTFLHDPVYLYVIFWVVSALADSMPQPTAASSIAYTWLHNFLQALMANISKIQSEVTVLSRLDSKTTPK